jgi:hypothetical protein
MPNGDMLSRIARRTGVSVDWLLGFDAPQYRGQTRSDVNLAADLAAYIARNVLQRLVRKYPGLGPPELDGSLVLREITRAATRNHRAWAKRTAVLAEAQVPVAELAFQALDMAALIGAHLSPEARKWLSTVTQIRMRHAQDSLTRLIESIDLSGPATVDPGALMPLPTQADILSITSDRTRAAATPVAPLVSEEELRAFEAEHSDEVQAYEHAMDADHRDYSASLDRKPRRLVKIARKGDAADQ